MKQQNQRISLTKRGGDTYTVNIIKNVKTREKKPRTRSFWFSSCFTLTCSDKFNSGDVVTEQKPFWASFRYILINYIPEKVGLSRIFVISWVFWVCVNDK